MNVKKQFISGILFVAAFAIWTWLIQVIDVQPVGQSGTDIGFAAFNCWFHKLTGVHMMIYIITDFMGLVPILVCMVFGVLGIVQLVKRRSLFKVDFDIVLLGIYYVIVIMCYLIFEMIPINFRPIFIGGFLEASYPSSTTLLVLSVMPTLVFQANHRLENVKAIKLIDVLTVLFLLGMVIGRLISGVHWFTDIVGSVLISTGLFYMYKAAVLLKYKDKWEVK